MHEAIHIIKRIREKQKHIEKRMDEITHEAYPFKQGEKRTPDMFFKFEGFEIPFNDLEKAGVPNNILDNLRHEDVQKMRAKYLERKRIDAEIEASLDKLEQDPEANKQEVINIFNKFREAENSIISTYPKTLNSHSIYQGAFDAVETAIRAINMMHNDEPPLFLEAPLKYLGGIREYCRKGKDRHATWISHRKDLKQMYSELAENLGVKVDEHLIPIPEIDDIYISIDAHPKKIKKEAESLVLESSL